MIRHAQTRSASSSPILALPVTVIQPPFRTALMALIGASTLFAPCPAAARVVAISMSAVALRTEEEHRPAIRAKAKPLQQYRIKRRHACRRRGWTTAPVRVSLDLSVSVSPFHEGWRHRGIDR
jgi:hypothetical protein